LLYKDESGNWVSAERIEDNEEAVTDIVLEDPVTASEFKLQNNNSGASPWGAIRIDEWQLFESDKLPKTENVMMHFATAENNDGANDKVMIENVQQDQVVRLYPSLESDDILAEKVAKEDGTLTFENLDFGEEAGRVYYTVQTPAVDESLKYSVGYLSEELTVSDLKLSVHEGDLKRGLSDSDTLHALKMHLTSLEHFEKVDKTDKVIKHLEGFKKLIDYQEENDLITEEASKSIKSNTNEAIENYR